MVKECMEALSKLPRSYTFRNVFEIMCEYGNRVAAELTEKDGALLTVTYEQYRQLARGIGQSLERKWVRKTSVWASSWKTTPCGRRFSGVSS